MKTSILTINVQVPLKPQREKPLVPNHICACLSCNDFLYKGDMVYKTENGCICKDCNEAAREIL